MCSAILSIGCRIENDSRPRPSLPATAALPSLVAAIQAGGCGSCTGFGVTRRRGNSRYLPWYSKYSSSHMWTTASIASSHSSRLSSRGTWKAVCSIGVDRPVPHSTRPPERMSAVATFSATRAGWHELVRHQHDAEAEAQVLRALRQRAEDHLGRRRVRPALAEVVLDVPRRVEPEGVGQLDLLDRLGVGPLLGLTLAVGVGPPRLRHVDLVQQVELHARRLPPGTGRSLTRTSARLCKRP